MAETRYVRWQGLAIAQLSFAINLFLGLSVGSLGFVVSLLREGTFTPSPCYTVVFLSASVLLCFATVCGVGAVVTRLLDFRLTAGKIRRTQTGGYSETTVEVYSDTEALGNATWRLFWSLAGCFSLGVAGLVVSVFSVYGGRLFL